MNSHSHVYECVELHTFLLSISLTLGNLFKLLNLSALTCKMDLVVSSSWIIARVSTVLAEKVVSHKSPSLGSHHLWVIAVTQ